MTPNPMDGVEVGRIGGKLGCGNPIPNYRQHDWKTPNRALCGELENLLSERLLGKKQGIGNLMCKLLCVPLQII